MYAGLRFEIATCVLSQVSDDGLMEFAPDYLGDELAGGDALESISPYGLVSRPREPTDGTGARLLVAWDGDLGFAMPCQDGRYGAVLPDPGAGGAALYAITDEEVASFLTINGSHGSFQAYVPHIGGSTASTFAIDVSTAGEESIQIVHGAGMKIEMTGGATPVTILHSADGSASITMKNGEIILNAPTITINGGANIGGASAVPVAKFAELATWAAGVVAACAAAPGGAITITPLSASGATTNLKGA